MKIFQPGYDGRIGASSVMVQPGTEVDTSEFKDDYGKAILYRVEFINGVAKVPANLGKWMTDKGYAKKSPVILPGEIVGRATA